jgi:peptidoglycan DL-endopeptidase CwlO
VQLRGRSASRPRYPEKRSRVFLLAGFLCLALLGGIFAPDQRANAATSISKKRKEAERLQAAIESTATKIELLNEDFLDAKVRLEKLTTKVTKSEAAAQAADRELSDLQKRIRAQALATYSHPPASQRSDALQSAQSINELERRNAYQKKATAASFDVEDALRASLASLKERRAVAANAKALVAREVKTLSTKQQKADALLKDYEVLEVKARGDLASLLRAAEKAAAEKEARDARVAQAKRQAAARAELQRRKDDTRKRLELGAKTGIGGNGGGKVPQISAPRRSPSGQAPAADVPKSGATARANPLPVPSESVDQKTDAELAIDAGVSAEVPASPGARVAVQMGLAQVGKPYVWAAAGPSSFDCSGLMLFAWRAAGVSLPHSSRAQYAATTRVSVEQIQPGDLVFYGSPIHHVGMYVGGGNMVEASRSGYPVRVKSIHRRDLVGVGRVR